MRVIRKLSWIFIVTGRLSADVASAAKLWFGGFWLLIRDHDKSTSSFSVNLRAHGTVFPFHVQDLGDYGTLCEIFVDRIYDIDLSAAPETIVDLGSNIGLSAIYFVLRYPDAVIYCLEPDPHNYERLKQNTEPWDNIQAHQIAIWSDTTSIPFFVDPHRGNSSSCRMRRARQAVVSVDAQTLDSIIFNFDIDRIDLLKFDVEGAEMELLGGLTNHDAVRVMLGEVHTDLTGGLHLFLDQIPDHYDVVTKQLAADRYSCEAHNQTHLLQNESGPGV